MKYFLTISFLFILSNALTQSLKSIEKELDFAFSEINNWKSYKIDSKTIDPYDSLELANEKFERLLLKYTSSNAQTISYGFKVLIDSGLIISTSEDGRFRIYSWDTRTGGTMHNFRNVFQFKGKKRVFSKTFKVNKKDEEEDFEPYFDQINDVVSNTKKFYVTQSNAILSGGLSYHNIKIFSIDNSKLNDTAKLIKTKTGIKNELGYEVDLTASANLGREIPDFYIKYDKANKIISIPVILDDSKVAAKRIQYQFKGKYFEKL